MNNLMRDFRIKRIRDAEIDACIELLKKTYPLTSNKETFHWRFKSKFDTKPLLIAAIHDNMVVSFISWIKWDFQYRGKTYIGHQAGEAATDIKHRKKGIWGQLLKYGHRIAESEGIDFQFGFPSTLSYTALYKAGYHPVGIAYFHIRIINPMKKPSGEKISENVEDIYQEILYDDDRISPAVNQGYFRWRYLESPKTYETLNYSENNNKALFILKLDSQCARRALYIRTFFNLATERGRMLKKHFPIPVKKKYDTLIIRPVSKRVDNNIIMNVNKWDYMPHCVDEY